MTKKKILVVDDEPDFAEAIKAMLIRRGYDTRVAFDGEEAIDAIAEFAPELVILDVMMPGLNGHQVSRRIKDNPATRNIPVILLTAVANRVSTSPYTHRDMLETDADDYLPKPVEPEELFRRIDALI